MAITLSHMTTLILWQETEDKRVFDLEASFAGEGRVPMVYSGGLLLSF